MDVMLSVIFANIVILTFGSRFTILLGLVVKLVKVGIVLSTVKILKVLVLILAGFLLVVLLTGVISIFLNEGSGVDAFTVVLAITFLTLLGAILYTTIQYKTDENKLFQKPGQSTSAENEEVTTYRKRIFSIICLQLLAVVLYNLFLVIVVRGIVDPFYLLFFPYHIVIGLLVLSSLYMLYLSIKTIRQSVNHRKAMALIIFLILYTFFLPVVSIIIMAFIFGWTG